MYPGPKIRDRIAARARRDLCDIRNRFAFAHQAAFWLALEGFLLTDQTLHSWEHEEDNNVRHEQPTFDQPTFDVLVSRYEAYKDNERRIVTSDEFWKLNPHYLEKGPDWKIDDRVHVNPLVERRAILPRPDGMAKRAAMLTGFSGGKSQFLSDMVAPMLLCPEAKIDLVGLTYDTAEPEFSYIAEALFAENGFNLPFDKPDFPGIHKLRMTRPRPGVQPEIALSNGAIIRVVSYENRENLKGKQRDCYLFAEYYQFPGFDAYSDIAQNLDKGGKEGIALFATTPDAAHIEILVELGMSKDAPTWHVTTAVPRSKNQYAFKFAQMEEDRLNKTREKFKIGQMGVIGEYIGSCFNYKRKEREFTVKSHPDIWRDPRGASTRANLKIPGNWNIVGGADTGQHYFGVIAAFSDDNPSQMYILDEIGNYRYVATEIEKSSTYTLSQWYADLRKMSDMYGGNATYWCDPNAQMKWDAAVSAPPIALIPDQVGANPEARTEIFREMFQNNRVWFAPWLEVVPYECEIARFPPQGTSTGIWRRISIKDHALDPCEHIAAQRPSGRKISPKARKLFVEEAYGVDASYHERIDSHFG